MRLKRDAPWITTGASAEAVALLAQACNDDVRFSAETELGQRESSKVRVLSKSAQGSLL
ncbi:hypothetical protein [Sphingomonas jatrophae]|uniref:hypothetical protein n=1 Tax=Sphingomonas jatrophae TaxID=1166337 RepID=UPI0013F4D282|nr:hypothetical protein [Sphingomonas jatrophae]